MKKLSFLIYIIFIMNVLSGCSGNDLKIIDNTGKSISVSSTDDKTYTFSIPSASNDKVTGWVNPFIDVDKSDWYYSAVRYCHENGLMSGTTPNTFSPAETTSRAMIVSILWRLEGSPLSALNTFKDVENNKYYADAVGWASANGIVSGFNADEFRPEQKITREQLISILCRYAAFKGNNISYSDFSYDVNDVAAVSDYAKEAVLWAKCYSVINDFDDTLIAPYGEATRAEAASILNNLCENVLK